LLGEWGPDWAQNPPNPRTNHKNRCGRAEPPLEPRYHSAAPRSRRSPFLIREKDRKRSNFGRVGAASKSKSPEQGTGRLYWRNRGGLGLVGGRNRVGFGHLHSWKVSNLELIACRGRVACSAAAVFLLFFSVMKFN
jgi:hypothetical protein